MKKFILGSLVLSGLLFSCDKANVQDSPNGMASTNVSALKAEGGPAKLNNSRYKVPGTQIMNCTNPGKDCRNQKTVAPSDIDLIQAVANDPQDLVSVFAEHQGVMVSYFSKEMVDGIINKTVTLEISGNFESGGITYFSFYSGSKYIQCAPLKK